MLHAFVVHRAYVYVCVYRELKYVTYSCIDAYVCVSIGALRIFMAVCVAFSGI